MRLNGGSNMPFPEKFLHNKRDTRKFIYTIREIFTDPIIKFYVRKIILRIIIIGIIIGTLIFLGIYLNKLFEALLVLVAWLQFELAYRQFWLYKKLQKPSFSLFLHGEIPYYFLYIQNVSSSPAYTIQITRILDKNLKPIPPERWGKRSKNISYHV